MEQFEKYEIRVIDIELAIWQNKERNLDYGEEHSAKDKTLQTYGLLLLQSVKGNSILKA